MRLRQPAAALTIGLLGLLPALSAAAAPLATAAPKPVPEAVVPVSGTVTVIGKGYGHGRGMSQFGAAGAARAGLTWPRILAHYYPGTAAVQAPVRTIRVGLSDTIGTGLRVAAGPGLRATSATSTLALPTTVVLDGAPLPVARYEIVPDAGSGARLELVTADGRRTPFAAPAPTWTIAAADGAVPVLTSAGRTNRYLGSVAGSRVADRVEPVLHTTLESYLRMVVPAEVYTSWPGQALAAQAVAARTYAASHLTGARAGLTDICSSTRCQVVGPITTETASTRAAVAATAGVVLTHQGRPIRAEFSSSNGGWSAPGNAPYLPARSDPYDRSPLNHVGSWRADVPVARLAARYPAVGRITGLQVLARDGRGELGGRVTSVRLIGDKGRATTTGDAFRSATGIRSSLFAVTQPSRPDAAKTLSLAGRPALLAVKNGRLVTSTTVRTTTAPGDLRLVGPVGELDAAPGADAVAVTKAGRLRLLSGGTAVPTGGRDIASGLGATTAVLALDDMNGDRQRDLVLRLADGRLVRWTTDGRGGLLPGPGTLIGTGWGSMRSVVAADLSGDGRDDVVALAPDGTIWLYPTTGRDGFEARRSLGRVPGYRALASGDRTGDGRDDVLGLDAAGAVWLQPQIGPGRLGPRARTSTMPGAASLL